MPLDGHHQERRAAIGNVRVVVAERFFDGPTVIVLEVGEVVRLLAPTDLERKRLADFVHKDAFRRTPHVVIEWRGARRFCPVASVRGEDERSASVLTFAGDMA